VLITLDIDDTLYLERDYVLSGFHAVDAWLHANGHGFDFANKAWALFEQGLRGTIFNQVMAEKAHRDAGLISQMIEIYRSHSPCISLLPDAKSFFQSCGNHDLAVISDGPFMAQERKVIALGLNNYVNTIILTDRWGREFWKPSPRAFREVMEQRAPEECVYIADNPEKDFIAPVTLGWQPSFRVRRQHSLHELKITPKNCREIVSLNDLKL